MGQRNDIPVIGQTKMFAALSYGNLFTVDDSGRIYCKTPMADMYAYNNRYNQDGAFCNAILVNPLEGQEAYIQCPPDAICTIVDTKKIFGAVERY